MERNLIQQKGVANMTLDQIKDTVIKPKLIESFGNMLGGAIMANCSIAAMKGKTDKEKLVAIIDAVCQNDKVKAMWGGALTAKRKSEWSSLI
jgi:hypothetical protein